MKKLSSVSFSARFSRGSVDAQKTASSESKAQTDAIRVKRRAIRVRGENLRLVIGEVDDEVHRLYENMVSQGRRTDDEGGAALRVASRSSVRFHVGPHLGAVSMRVELDGVEA